MWVATHELAGAVRFKLDLGERIKQSPLTWVIGACLVGAWLGSRGARERIAGQRSRG
jgi:hypothetical protein